MSSAQPRPVNRHLLNIGLGCLAAAFAGTLILRGAASVSAWLTGLPEPTAGIVSGIGVLARPGDPASAFEAPGLDPLLYWGVAAAMMLVVAAPGVWAMLWLTRRRGRTDVHALAGIADAREIAQVASGRTAVKRAANLRPSVVNPASSDVGYLLGTGRGGQVWATIEDSMLLVGPPRSGKGLHVVVNAILDAPGPVLTTSTRPDNLTVTLKARQRRGGPVAVFDPQQLAPGVPSGMRWSPVRGCEVPLTAMIRATGLAASTGYGDVEGGGFWEGKTRSALQALLHAAALDGRDARDLFRWAIDPAAAQDAVRILSTNTAAATGWADSLDSMLESDPRTRDSIWQGVSLALQSLADPRVLDAVTPREGDDFDPEKFLSESGTLFLLATGAGAGASGGLVAALIEDLVEVARRRAAASAGARLDPPLLMALDEIGNLAPLPSLPILMAEGGGTGITLLPVLQSLAQARNRWNEHAASAIWDSSIVKIILGGASGSRDLQDISTLIGDRDESTDSLSTDAFGQHSISRSIRRVPILPPDLLRTLPFGTGVVLLRAARPIVTDLRPWTARTDAAQLKADRLDIEAMIRQAAAAPDREEPLT